MRMIHMFLLPYCPPRFHSHHLLKVHSFLIPLYLTQYFYLHLIDRRVTLSLSSLAIPFQDVLEAGSLAIVHNHHSWFQFPARDVERTISSLHPFGALSLPDRSPASTPSALTTRSQSLLDRGCRKGLLRTSLQPRLTVIALIHREQDDWGNRYGHPLSAQAR